MALVLFHIFSYWNLYMNIYTYFLSSQQILKFFSARFCFSIGISIVGVKLENDTQLLKQKLKLLIVADTFILSAQVAMRQIYITIVIGIFLLRRIFLLLLLLHVSSPIIQRSSSMKTDKSGCMTQ